MNATRTTGSDGRATVDLRSTIPGTAIVRGTIGVESAAIAITFDPGDPYRVTLTVQPTIIPVCGFTATARAEVRDRYGNLVRDGTMVYFEVSPPRGARIVPADGAPTTNGVAVATITSGMETGGATVRARALIYGTLYALGEFGVEFQAGPPDRVVPPAGQPLQLKVGGRTMAIRVQVVDCGGHGVVANTPVTFTIASGEGLFLPQRARTYRTVTLGEGWAEALLESPNQTGSATLVAAAGQREATIVVQYIPDVPFEMTVTADPMSIPANGVSTSTIVAEIKDFYGNHVADRTAVVFSTNLGRFTTGSSYTAFTVGGRASARLTSSTTPGLAQVVVLTTGVRREIYVDFYLEIPPTPTPTPIGATWLQRLPIIIKNYRRY